jgi:hypothetical protein
MEEGGRERCLLHVVAAAVQIDTDPAGAGDLLSGRAGVDHA